jgi:hypothetical protein
MLIFLEIALSFPTVIFGMLLAVAVLYWLLAATGLVEIDALDGWLGADSGEAASDQDFAGEPGGITGPLMRFGLGGVPLTLVFTVLILIAWMISYFADYLLLRHLPFATLRWGVGLLVLAGAFITAVPLTAIALRPVRRFFAKLRPAPLRSLLGMSAVVRSPDLTDTQGTVSVEDGGAGLILQARDDTPGRFRRGDRVVLIEYLAERNAYRVVSESEFGGL